MKTICLSLYEADPSANPRPLLAAALPTVSKDRLTVTIPLRKGVLFNDGTPFNAAAVVTTFTRDLTAPGSVRPSVFGPITSATASGPYTVQLHLSEPDAPLAAGAVLFNERIMSPAQLDKLGLNFGTDPVCVGPFMFQSEVAGTSVTVVRSPYFYDKQDVHLDKIVYQYLPDALSASAALEAGDVQALDFVGAPQLRDLEDHGLRIVGHLSLGFDLITVNLGNVNGVGKPLGSPGTAIDNPLVREAFEMAIDRKTLDRVAFGGLDVPGCQPLSPAAGYWYDPTIQCTPYDPAGARKLVQQSGIQNPTVQMMYFGQTREIEAEALKSMEAAAGITVVLDPEDDVTERTKDSAGAWQTGLWSQGQTKADPDWMYPSFEGGTGNSMGYDNPRLDLILKNGRLASSVQARETLYHAAERIIMADRAWIILGYQLDRCAISNQLTGVQVYADGGLRVAFAGFKAS
jgi:peptide/nickel transport system substrate-binding protein